MQQSVGPVSLSLRRDGSLVLEPVDVNNHPRRWPKDLRRDLQSRHRQLEATRSLSRPIITGTYSPVKCSSLPPVPQSRIPFSPFFFFTRSFSISIPSSPSTALSYPLLFGRTIKKTDNQGGWTEMDG